MPSVVLCSTFVFLAVDLYIPATNWVYLNLRALFYRLKPWRGANSGVLSRLKGPRGLLRADVTNHAGSA